MNRFVGTLAIHSSREQDLRAPAGNSGGRSATDDEYSRHLKARSTQNGKIDADSSDGQL